jgi:hypothetical protein
MTAGRHAEHTLEDLLEAQWVEESGWLKGNSAAFDAELALISAAVTGKIDMPKGQHEPATGS